MSVRDLTLIKAMIAAVKAIPALKDDAQDRQPGWREPNAHALGVQA